MWKLKEFRWFLYNNYLLLLLQTITLFLVLGVIYIFLLFSQDMFNTENNFKEVYSDKTMYELIDYFEDPNSFYEFRYSDESMARLKKFYDDLNLEKDFNFLASCDQQVAITNFKGDKKFKDKDKIFELNGKTYINIKGMQMNQNAFEFYQLNINKGTNFQWKDIDYADNKIPVILGADYEGIYDIGDIIEANYFSLNVELEVIGFLQRNSTMYHKYEVRRCLDQYILVPYPEKGYENMEKQFRGILYSAMINGNIVVENTDNAVQLVLDKLSEISRETGYYEYTLIGIPIFKVQYNMVMSIVQANKSLIMKVLVLMVGITTFIMGCFSYFLYQRRQKNYDLYKILGYSKQEIHSMIFREISFPYIAAFLLLSIFYFHKCWLYWSCGIKLALIDVGWIMCIYWFVRYLQRRNSKDYK